MGGGPSRLTASTDCRISGNYIGLSSGGTEFPDRSGGFRGVHLASDAKRNTIGGGTGSGNVFGDLRQGIYFWGADRNRVAGNWFGLGADGETEVPIVSSGIHMQFGAHHNLFIGLADIHVRDPRADRKRIPKIVLVKQQIVRLSQG